MTGSEKGAKVGSSSRHEVQTLADLVVSSACSVRTSLPRVLTLALDHVDEGSWNRVTIEYAVLHLYLLSEHAHQVLVEREAHSLVGEIADRVSQAVAHRLGTTLVDQRTVVVYFGETLKERFAAYHRQPIVVDPEAGEMVEIQSFDRVRGTVFGSFVETLGALLCAAPERNFPPDTALDLWLESLTRSEAFGRVYTPLIDLLAANASAAGASRA